MSRDRPTSIGIGIIKFNARTNSVCSSPSASCTAAALSSRRVDTLSVGAESSAVVEPHQQQQLVQQRFVELCADDDDEATNNSAPVSEADECGSVADEGENVVQTCGLIISPSDVPVEEVIKSVRLVDQTIPSNVAQPKQKMDSQNTASTAETSPGRVHKLWHKFLGIFRHYRTLPFRRLRLISVAFLLIAFFSLPSFFAGLLTGVYLSLLAFLFCCVSDPMSAAQRWRRDQQRLTSVEQLDHVGLGDNDEDKNDDSGQTVPSRDIAIGQQKQEKGSSTGRIYKGWMNILSEHYHPHTFHVNSIQTVLVRLDGHLLRISRPERTMLKHCFHIDPTLTEPEPRMISQKIYDLTDAQVVLRPRRLARRRWFSRKYPICIKLAPSDSDGGHNSADVVMKRCHSLRQRRTNRHSNDNGTNAKGTGTGGRKMSSAIGADFCSNNGGRSIGGARECDGEGRESDGADSAGDSVQSESTDDELNLAFYECQQLLSTARPPAPVLSASCPTPTGATASMPSSSATIAATGGHRRGRRRTVPPPCDVEEDGNGGNGASGGTNGIRRRQCSTSSAAYIFLFARSTREKERWFHRLRQATLRQQNAADYFPAHFSTKIPHRCTSVPSLERLAAKLSDARVAYTLQNAQFAKQLATMIAGLGCAAASGVTNSSSSSSPYYGGVGGDEQPTADSGGVVRMDLGWTTTRHNNRNANNGQHKKQNGEATKTTEQEEREQYSNNEFILLVNLIASRVFYDFCRDNYWCGAVRNKIQTKLATIHLPYFIETLELSKLDLGTITPQIVRVHPPTVNEWGIWCDFDIKYDGMIRLVLETRVNLMKLKSVSESSSTATTPSSSCPIISGAGGAIDPTATSTIKNGAVDEQQQQRQRHSCGGCCATSAGGGTAPQTMPTSTTTPLLPRSSCSTYRIAPNRYSDEEIPESPETSPDEEFGSMLKPDDWVGGAGSGATATRRMKTGQKLISWVDRIAHTKYFREASELKLIRKMMEEISSMRLLLNVQVTTLEGRMCCNFPPPPSDRLWYAFRTSPRMSVKAVPQVGDRSVELSLVSEWIENKLQLILEKNLVLPNMDDVIIPVCSGNKLLQGGLNR